MEFNINPKRLALQDAAGMQIIQIIRELVAEINNDPYDSLPSDLGTASAGSSNKYARGDHVHPKPSASDIGAVSTNQGSDNAGKWLMVDTDGSVIVANLPVYNGGVA